MINTTVQALQFLMEVRTYGSSDETDRIFPDVMQTDKLVYLAAVNESEGAGQQFAGIFQGGGKIFS